MNVRDFRIGWRMLVKEPAYSAVIIASLAIGLAVCFLLLGYIRYSLSYDADVPQAERIFLVKQKINTRDHPTWNESVPLPFFDVVRKSGMAETSSVVLPLLLSMQVDSLVQSVEVAAVHPEFARLFNTQAIEGDLQAALSRPDSLALTVSIAQRLFGTSDGVIGKTVQISGKPFNVAALIPDRPSNTTISYGALAGVNTSAWDDKERKELSQAWGNINGAKIYVKLAPGVTAAALEQFLQEAADHSPFSLRLAPEEKQKLGQRKLLDIRLGALSEMYFDMDTAGTQYSGPHGDPRALAGLAVVALLILLLASGNYVNLATVRTVRRQREIATRKVLGASIRRLIGQFLAESLAVSLIATLFGLALAMALRPMFANLVNRKMDHLFTPESLLACLLLGVIVGLLAGAYPAWTAVRVRPQQTLAGRGVAENMGGMWLRRVLTIVQFSTAIALTAVTLAISWQTRFASKVDPGFNPAPLLVLELPSSMQSPGNRALREALTRLPGVSAVAASADPIGRNFVGGYIRVSLNNGNWARVLVRPVSANFFEAYGLQPLAGRLFSSKLDKDEDGFQSLVINARMAQELGFATPEQAIGQIVTYGSGDDAITGPIIGVAPEVRYQSLRRTPQPVLYFTSLDTPTLTVQATGDLQTIEEQAEALVRQYLPNDVVVMRRAGTYFADNYAEDLRLASLLTLATVIAVVLTAFGIYALSAYSVQRMSKRIVLHKLFGAGSIDIARLVGREFIALILVGAAVGIPVAIVTTENYLGSFAERAPSGIWPQLLALLVVLLVTLASTLQNTLTAMRMSPALVLRD